MKARNYEWHGHGGIMSPTYVSWLSMKQRCYNPNRTGYENYGGRGIRVCKWWRDSFKNFLEDMGERPPGLTLDREDNDLDYSPSNCKWATRSQQSKKSAKATLTWQLDFLILSNISRAALWSYPDADPLRVRPVD